MIEKKKRYKHHHFPILTRTSIQNFTGFSKNTKLSIMLHSIKQLATEDTNFDDFTEKIIR